MCTLQELQAAHSFPERYPADCLVRCIGRLDPSQAAQLHRSMGADEVCACDLLEPSGRSQPTVSDHMKILVDAGLIERDKRGLWVWYRLVPSRLDALRSVLD